MVSDENQIAKKLISLVEQALQQDQALREQYAIGEKFRFIKDRLQALLNHLQNQLPTNDVTTASNPYDVAADEMIVYVYLFNAQGIAVQNWFTMITPQALSDYNVNRPIYADKSDVTNLIRNKPNPVQHAYITIVVKKSDVSEEKLSDATGKLVKVNEKALDFRRIIAFTHNDIEYTLTSENKFQKKT